MVAEKMKLRILEVISVDLANHVNTVFDNLIKQKDDSFSLDDIIDNYLSHYDKSRDLINSNLKTSEVIEIKRDIAFIYYCLACPFFYTLGVDERLDKIKTEISVNKLNISRARFPTYIMSAKHYYRIYNDYREKIDLFVTGYIKK